jgi:hypothetical protein
MLATRPWLVSAPHPSQDRQLAHRADPLDPLPDGPFDPHTFGPAIQRTSCCWQVSWAPVGRCGT